MRGERLYDESGGGEVFRMWMFLQSKEEIAEIVGAGFPGEGGLRSSR